MPRLAVFLLASTLCFVAAWAAVHDLVRDPQGPWRLESAVLIASVISFFALIRAAARHRPARSRRIWIAAHLTLLALFLALSLVG